LLYPGEEDFGIVPVEAQSFGRPVIAYASGGVLETVRGTLPDQAGVENPTGIFFTDQSFSGLTKAILEFESREHEFRPQTVREHSLQFDSSIFKQRISEFVTFALEDFNAQNRMDSVKHTSSQTSRI
jgi:glycosyltransferase involved in cell wall biosynthesis